MARRRRNNYDPMATVNAPRWYVVVDQFNAVVESEQLAPGANLRAIIREVMETRAQRGWEIEVEDEPRFGGFFCSKEGVRLYICIRPTDPGAPAERYFNPYQAAQTAPISANTTDMELSPTVAAGSAFGDEEAHTPPTDRHAD